MMKFLSSAIHYVLAMQCMVLLIACKPTPEPESSSAIASPSDQLATRQETTQSGEASIQWPEDIESTAVAMDLKQVSEHTYYVEGPPGTPTDNQGFMSNAGVVITNEGVVVFDALGTPSLAYKLLTKIRTLTDQPVVKVVASHYHADHIYGLQVFRERGAEIIAPAGAKKYLASDAAEGRLKQRRESLFPWVNEETYIVKPDRFIEEDTVIHMGNITLELLVLGSTHSEGDLMMRVKPDNILFSGDLIFDGRIPFVAGSDPDNWLQRLKQLDTSGLKAVVPGHGSMSTHPQRATAFTREYLEYLYKTMGEAVDNLMTFDNAYQQTDWTKYEDLPAFMANRMNAYFLFLRLEEASMQ
ncbi:MAG: MBL fold metallo-hydrolase [Gammaproteobacteria bacterium]|jgi:glyoxylase-like metal-dependent hydrolase (beta-lactamase superfamily II)